MISKDQLAAGMLYECDICLHLFGKLNRYDYRPSPAQRDTAELLRYISIVGIASLRSLGEKNWKIFGEYVQAASKMEPKDFPDAMNRQKQEILNFFKSYSEKQLETQEAPLPMGTTQPLGEAILNMSFKIMPSYKLQLFLYAKASGADKIGTANAWAGKDWNP
jgi:hypothetical protein